MTRESKERRATAEEHRADLLQTVNRLRRPNELAEVVSLPPDLAAALVTGRPELLKIAQPRAMSEDEVRRLYHLIGVLIETNHELQNHATELAKMARQAYEQQRGTMAKLLQLEEFAGFKERDAPEGDQL